MIGKRFALVGALVPLLVVLAIPSGSDDSSGGGSGVAYAQIKLPPPPSNPPPATCGLLNGNCCGSNPICTGNLTCVSGKCVTPAPPPSCGLANQNCCANNACGPLLSCMGGKCWAPVIASKQCNTTSGPPCASNADCVNGFCYLKDGQTCFNNNECRPPESCFSNTCRRAAGGGTSSGGVSGSSNCPTACATCSAANPTQCATCAAGRYLANGTCNVCTVCNTATMTQTAACTATANTVCTANVAPNNNNPGMANTNNSCSASNLCASGICFNGTCRQETAGASCSNNNPCTTSGQTCHKQSAQAANGTCEFLGGIMQPCSNGNLCSSSAVCEYNVCVPRGAENYGCRLPTRSCNATLSCIGGDATGAGGVCKKTGGLGQPCTPTATGLGKGSCSGSLVCSNGNTCVNTK